MVIYGARAKPYIVHSMHSILAGFVTTVVVFVGLLAMRPVPVGAARAGDDARAFLQTYCITCHTQQMKSRGTVPVALDALDASAVANDAKTWESIVRKMRAGVMPPAGMKRPDKVAHEQFLAWVEGELDRAARERPNPGRTEVFHRLNRTEYRNAVRDLLDLDVDVSGWLPPDDASYGFDNIAGVLKISPTLFERYLSAAQKISRTALGIAPPSPTVDYFRVADDRAQEQELPGQLFGTRGGASIRYTFPMDASYTVRVQLSRDLNEQVPIYVEPQDLEISIDGQRVKVFTLQGAAAPAGPPASEPAAAADSDAAQPAGRGQGRGAGARASGAGRGGGRQGQEARNRADRDWEVRVPVKAGPHVVQVAFAKQSDALAETARLPFLRPYPAGVNIAETRSGAYLRSIEIAGPFDATGAGNSPSRQRIMICTPASRASEEACSTRILTALARRAYRRPVTDADVRPLLAFYREGRAEGSFDQGIERALNRLLVSAEFLLRVETDPPRTPPGSVYRINDVAVASRLSFFLWNSIPDEELLTLAEQKRLNDPAVLDRQVRRMIADPRFDSFVETFAGQWLFLRNLAASVPVQQNFPDFDDTLRQAFRTETELFFKSVIHEDRSALDLLRADYTFLNERLAGHYGIAGVKGTRFRRVTIPPGSRRAGLLGQGSILTVTSYPDRTSPVVRGKWILENLLGTPPPSPPPGVPPLKPPSFATKVLSVRERMVDHRRNPPCAGCHAMMDPLGLALENFDAVGKWRALDESGGPIDASGSMPDGTKFDGADGLRQALLGSDRFVMTLTEKLMTYALGRGVDYYDEPAVRAIVRTASRDDFRFVSLIRGVVQSVPFQMRRAQ
jgi:mono/diheme cytochrome c family protein